MSATNSDAEREVCLMTELQASISVCGWARKKHKQEALARGVFRVCNNNENLVAFQILTALQFGTFNLATTTRFSQI